MKRRDFIKTCSAAAATSSLVGLSGCAPATESGLPMPSPAKLPRWRGFNLLEKFIARVPDLNRAYFESDFEMIADLGFDFARLPMSYRCWSTPDNWQEMDESVLQEIDQALEYGRQHNVHISINFHRAPGYSVDRGQTEPFNLWKDQEALDACVHHWAAFAERFKGIPSSHLSFDLVNEPAVMDWDTGEWLDDVTYHRVVKALVEAIREHDPERLIIADGLGWGRVGVPMLAELNVAQSTRGYHPHRLTHYKASWVGGSDEWDVPTWPMESGQTIESKAAEWARLRGVFSANTIYEPRFANPTPPGPLDRANLREENIEPWQELESMGVGVHVGECGCYNQTPHDVFLSWFEDNLAEWKRAGWGFGLWNLRGSFGILDSERTDVAYEDYHGHQLDRKLLELMQAY